MQALTQQLADQVPRVRAISSWAATQLTVTTNALLQNSRVAGENDDVASTYADSIFHIVNTPQPGEANHRLLLNTPQLDAVLNRLLERSPDVGADVAVPVIKALVPLIDQLRAHVGEAHERLTAARISHALPIVSERVRLTRVVEQPDRREDDGRYATAVPVPWRAATPTRAPEHPEAPPTPDAQG